MNKNTLKVGNIVYRPVSWDGDDDYSPEVVVQIVDSKTFKGYHQSWGVNDYEINNIYWSKEGALNFDKKDKVLLKCTFPVFVKGEIYNEIRFKNKSTKKRKLGETSSGCAKPNLL